MRNKRKDRKTLYLFYLLFFTSYFLFPVCSSAVLIDRVVAFIDNRAITLRELEDSYEKAKKASPGITMKEALNTMINRRLLIDEAKKLKIEGKDDKEILDRFIEMKVRALIRIREEDMEDFYNKNKSEFKDKNFEDVRDRIEEYLTEKEVNILLEKHIRELRAKAYIKIVDESLR